MRVAMWVLVAALGGCAGMPESSHETDPKTAPVVLTPQQVNGVHAAARKVLKDPDSARFGGLVAGRAADSRVLFCGMLNAKNSFGGYTGMMPYLGFIDPAGTIRMEVIANDRLETDMVDRSCRRRGLLIPDT